ncbi:MAG: hypothetical protein LQ340_007094 [Diploschistes diacapsis]|nr:MAG: hypothetical protein LQ340_007094 [Diploschistes diacapsis]
MPRKDFKNDLEQASVGILPANLFALKEGEDDGTFTFVFKSPKIDCGVTFQAHISDVGDYPKAHSFFIFAISEYVSERIGDAIADIGSIEGLTIENLIKFLANKLNSSLATSNTRDNEDLEMLDDEGWDKLEEPPEGDDESEDGFPYDDDDPLNAFDSAPNEYRKTSATTESLPASDLSEAELKAFQSRVRADLREVTNAGFRFASQGFLLHPRQSCYVMVSCRVAKLGIPEDAMKAWYLDREEYIMLLIHYPHGYKTLEQITFGSKVKMHVGVTKKHKVSLHAAIETFTQVEHERNSPNESQTQDTSGMSIRPLFIGAALNDLLNSRLVALICYRQDRHLSWTGAEALYNDSQGRGVNAHLSDSRFQYEADFVAKQHLTRLATSDHLEDRTTTFSFPLVAAQFALHRLVYCTDFCLVCWCKTGDDFDALKPYVCSKPLCLFQYINLGFGPSIEFEILTQPYVVDLLISFCYVSASARSLKEFPAGLGINVPHPNHFRDSAPTPGPNPMYAARFPRRYGDMIPQSIADSGPASVSVKAIWDKEKKEFTLSDTRTTLPRAGEWVCFWEKRSVKHHCRITETFYPSVRHGPVITEEEENSAQNEQQTTQQYGYSSQVASSRVSNALPQSPLSNANSPSKSDHSIEVRIVSYSNHFDDLSNDNKQASLVGLLNSLPSVFEMRDYLQKKRKQGTLQNWTEKITPSALSVLRWIIASNRSCIVQPENLTDTEKPAEEQVYGMNEYLQFRFASGAPDKESRFVKNVRDTTARLWLQHPTLFAWHGSPLCNWHSIVREGLNYDRISHGRAFGNGVYHSLYSSTSLGYSQFGYDSKSWPSSSLKITNAVSLNEIVNAPAEYVSRSPHLVVGQVDWIQTRYLFVKASLKAPGAVARPLQVLDQDPSMTPVGPTNEPLVIPIAAISRSRRPGAKAVASGVDGNKRSKVSTLGKVYGNDEDDVCALSSDTSDDEDRELLFPANVAPLTDHSNRSLEEKRAMARRVVPKRVPQESTALFVPGTLDRSSLPLLAPPTYATTQATKALQREIKNLLKTQNTVPAEELGWYFDPELVENPYQLIVELHSFDSKLPLAQDMQAQKVNSVILELRFGQGFPFSPPFIRVIRPRFLPFMSGGGGHVTAGGAICMELLTNSGWNPSTVLDAILLQVRMAITSTEPRPARLEKGGVQGDYGVGEAAEAYKRACITHGWQISADFQSMSTMGHIDPMLGRVANRLLAPATPSNSGTTNFPTLPMPLNLLPKGSSMDKHLGL